MTGQVLNSRFELAEVGSPTRRIIDAADECVCRWGWAKTTVSDIAAEASISRATIYRVFPGGRDAIYEALRRHRDLTFFGQLMDPLAAAENLLDALTNTMVAAAVGLRDDENFQYQLAHEPGPLLQMLTFDGLDTVLAAARLFVAPSLIRFVPRRDAIRLAEWATRIVVSYTIEPSAYLDLTDQAQVRRFVATRALAGVDGEPPTSTTSLSKTSSL